MNDMLPSLEVRGPEGQAFTNKLSKSRVTIGRFREANDVVLEPDPQQLVTRKAHCIVAEDDDGWWLIDNGSVNKTFLRRGDAVQVVEGRAPLRDGDIIRVLGRLDDGGTPTYWELTFRDPAQTRPAVSVAERSYLEYDWVQARLFRVGGSKRERISHLRPQEHKLIRYMDGRNRANNHTPVMCTYEELIAAIFGDEGFHSTDEVKHLVSTLRKKIEDDPKEPRFLQNVRGMGYLLETGRR